METYLPASIRAAWSVLNSQRLTEINIVGLPTQRRLMNEMSIFASSFEFNDALLFEKGSTEKAGRIDFIQSLYNCIRPFSLEICPLGLEYQMHVLIPDYSLFDLDFSVVPRKMSQSKSKMMSTSISPSMDPVVEEPDKLNIEIDVRPTSSELTTVMINRRRVLPTICTSILMCVVNGEDNMHLFDLNPLVAQRLLDWRRVTPNEKTANFPEGESQKDKTDIAFQLDAFVNSVFFICDPDRAKAIFQILTVATLCLVLGVETKEDEPVGESSRSPLKSIRSRKSMRSKVLTERFDNHPTSEYAGNLVSICRKAISELIGSDDNDDCRRLNTIKTLLARKTSLKVQKQESKVDCVDSKSIQASPSRVHFTMPGVSDHQGGSGVTKLKGLRSSSIRSFKSQPIIASGPPLQSGGESISLEMTKLSGGASLLRSYSSIHRSESKSPVFNTQSMIEEDEVDENCIRICDIYHECGMILLQKVVEIICHHWMKSANDRFTLGNMCPFRLRNLSGIESMIIPSSAHKNTLTKCLKNLSSLWHYLIPDLKHDAYLDAHIFPLLEADYQDSRDFLSSVPTIKILWEDLIKIQHSDNSDLVEKESLTALSWLELIQFIDVQGHREIWELLSEKRLVEMDPNLVDDALGPLDEPLRLERAFTDRPEELYGSSSSSASKHFLFIWSPTSPGHADANIHEASLRHELHRVFRILQLPKIFDALNFYPSIRTSSFKQLIGLCGVGEEEHRMDELGSMLARDENNLHLTVNEFTVVLERLSSWSRIRSLGQSGVGQWIKTIKQKSQKKVKLRNVELLQDGIRRFIVIKQFCEFKSLLRVFKVLTMLTKNFYLSERLSIEYRLFQEIGAGQERSAVMVESQIVIASWWRGVVDRKRVQRMRWSLIRHIAGREIRGVVSSWLAQNGLMKARLVAFQMDDQATKIQSIVRMRASRKWFCSVHGLAAALPSMKRISLRYESATNRVNFHSMCKGSTLAFATAENRKQSQAAMSIQSTYKGYLARKQFKGVKEKSGKLVSLAQTALLSKRFLRNIASAQYIQRYVQASKMVDSIVDGTGLVRADPISIRSAVTVPHAEMNILLSLLLGSWIKKSGDKHAFQDHPAIIGFAFLPGTRSNYEQSTHMKMTWQRTFCALCRRVMSFDLLDGDPSKSTIKAVSNEEEAKKIRRILTGYGIMSQLEKQVLMIDKTQGVRQYENALAMNEPLLISGTVYRQDLHELLMYRPLTNTEAVEGRLPQLTMVDISVGGDHSLALFRWSSSSPCRRYPQGFKGCSLVMAWGNNDSFQLGAVKASRQESVVNNFLLDSQSVGSSQTTLSRPTAVALLQYRGVVGPLKFITHENVDVTHRINKVWAGNRCSFALTDSGQLFAWGDNSRGICGVGKNYQVVIKPTLVSFQKMELSKKRGGTVNRMSHKEVKIVKVLTIQMSRKHVMALCDDPSDPVWIWGDRRYVGLKITSDLYEPIPLMSFSVSGQGPAPIVSSIHPNCGYSYITGTLNHRDFLIGFGRNDRGQLAKWPVSSDDKLGIYKELSPVQVKIPDNNLLIKLTTGKWFNALLLKPIKKDKRGVESTEGVPSKLYLFGSIPTQADLSEVRPVIKGIQRMIPEARVTLYGIFPVELPTYWNPKESLIIFSCEIIWNNNCNVIRLYLRKVPLLGLKSSF
eukprot:GHVH01000474.1.p1 GENE.GHVH01000474.1~~GHVH01000474.1.p1  ORF type:complete len:1817 (+),score=227.84 GHVH01000474.1:476-5452(+)